MSKHRDTPYREKGGVEHELPAVFQLCNSRGDRIWEIREISDREITRRVRDLCIEANIVLADDLIEAYMKGYEREESPLGKDIFTQLVEVKKAMKEQRAVYFAAIGGTGALISKTIKRVEVVAYKDLGPEAIRRIDARDFPAIVVNDVKGNDLYDEGKKKYRKI